MSIEHMAMVFAADGIGAKQRLLLLAYANRCDAHGFCWPGEERLVAETGMSASTVRRAKSDLTKMGLVKSVRRPDTSSMTRINIKLLASMRRPEQDFDDNLIEKFGFAEDAPSVSQQAPDLRTGHIDLAVRSGCSDGQVNMTSGPGHIDLKTLSEPSVETSSSPTPPSPAGDPVRPPDQGGGGGDAPQRQEQDSDAAAFVDALPYCGPLPGPKARAHLVERAAAAMAAGWTEHDLRTQLTADTSNAKSMAAVFRYRLDPENLPAPPDRTSPAVLPGPRVVVNDTAGTRRECTGQDGMCGRPLTDTETSLCRRCAQDTMDQTAEPADARLMHA